MPKPYLLPKADGRWIAAGMVIGFFLLLKIAAMILDKPVFELPPFQWFGPMAPYFSDLRAVASWSEQFLADPSTPISALHDPWNRPYNYPLLWLYAGEFGLNARTVMDFGYGMGALFLASAFFVLGKLNRFEGLVAGLFLISYAALFGLERANVDLLMFTLLAMALEFRRFPAMAALIITLAAVLKIHPIFAFLALLAPPWKKNLPSLAIGLAIAAARILGQIHAFLTSMISAPNMRTGNLSFGITSAGADFIERFHRPDLSVDMLVLGGVLFILATGIGAWTRPTLDVVSLDERGMFAFRLGAGIYLGSFLLGTNHDYRAVFLLFCLPLLFTFLRSGIALPWARAALILTLVYVNWLYFAGESPWGIYLLKQGIAWALVICLTGLSIATLPPALQWPRRIRAGQPMP